MNLADIDIDALEAGPETDALVAEVLGFNIARSPHNNRAFRCWPRGEAPGSPMEVSWSGKDLDVHDIPRYSTDWNAAMQAAEETKLLEPWARWDYFLAGGSGRWAVFEMDFYDSDHEPLAAEAPTGPLAICRAILKLKQEQQPCRLP